MSKRKSGFDFDDMLEKVFDEPFEALDRGFEALDNAFEGMDSALDDLIDGNMDDSQWGKVKQRRNRHPKKKHKIEFTDQNGASVVVRFNDANDLAIQTSGDLDDRIIKEIKGRIDGYFAEKQRKRTEKRSRGLPRARTRSQHESLEAMRMETHPTYSWGDKRPLFYPRNWKGEAKDIPLEFTADSRVAVSRNTMFGRKYAVEVDGTTVYFVKIEEMMEKCADRGNLDLFINDMTDDEKAIMRKVINGLRHLNAIEPHHEEAATLLG